MALGQRRCPRWTYKRPKRNSLTGTDILGTENSLKTLSNNIHKNMYVYTYFVQVYQRSVVLFKMNTF